ncbi:hypothetical protein LENED_007560 [Lentinula edodes]|uniref:Chromo domain-containing protein n=1 Tax=Lentinula edodes TaxID=5353 RepID=A0A1Q3EEP8_LENED|nr:hypothetical protein LENED_007560 [Lentinula edodes]
MVSRPKKKARVEVEKEEEDQEQEEEEEPEEEEEESEFDVVAEYLKGAKVDDDGEWRYLVKWHGYDEPKHDTWEPEEHIANCQRLLASFWQEIGTDDNDYDPGYQCAPSEAWIKKEKARFVRDNPDTKNRIAAQKAREAEQEKKRQERRQKQKKKPAVPKRNPKNTTSKKDSMELSSTATHARVKEVQTALHVIASKKGKLTQKSTQKSTIQADISSDSELLSTKAVEKSQKMRKVKKPTIVSSDSSSDSDRPLVQGKRKRSNVKFTVEATKDKKIDSLSREEGTGEEEIPQASAADPASLFTPEKSTTQKLSRQSPEEKEAEPLSYTSLVPSSSMPTVSVQAETKKKASLPRLPPVRATSGPSTGKSTSFPILPTPKVSLPPKLSIQTKLRTDSPVSAGGISTKQRLAQAALQMTTPTEKVAEASRPLPPQKALSLSGMNFKKNRGPLVKASPTITTADMLPKNVPVYSPQDMPSSSVLSSSTNTGRLASQQFSPNIGSELPPSLSRKRTAESEDQTLSQKIDQTASTRVDSFIPLVSPAIQLSEDIEMAHPVVSAPLSPPMLISTSSALNDEAEDFLQSVMSTAKTSSKADSIWTGKIMVHVDDNNEAQTISIEVMLLPSDPSAGQIALQQGVMPLKVAMSYNDSKLSMKSRSFYRSEDLNGIVAACNPVQEWGWLDAETEQDARKLGKVADYLSHEKLVGFVPVTVEGNVVAMTLIHPSTLIHDCLPRVKSFGPHEIALMVSLYSWNLKSEDRSLDKMRKHFTTQLDGAWLRRDFKLPQGLYEAYGEPGIKPFEGLSGCKLMAKHAVRMLELPELIHSYLVSGGERPFAFWPPLDSEAFCLSPIPSIERELLVALLNEYPATIDRGTVANKQDLSLRVIFVHVNSLRSAPGQGNIRDLPNLSGYRTGNDVRFIAYGSSDVVNPRFSDIMEEIWHIGGIVTFTASALLSDPLGVNERILQIEEHEFWACYVLPAVIGMAVSIAYRGREHLIQKRIACDALVHGIHRAEAQSVMIDVDEDGVDENEIPCTCDGFAYEWLLDAIDEELVSVIGAPPLHSSDPHLGGHGAIIHPGVPRDGRPRGKEEWKQLSDTLQHSSSSTAFKNTGPPPQEQFPPSSVEAQYNDPFVSWILQLFDSDVRSRSQTLDFCVQEFKRICGTMPQEEWENVIKKEITEELGRMQISRGFREELRRFVVVTGSEDKDIQTDQGGFEWVTPASFKFHDVTDNDLNAFIGL